MSERVVIEGDNLTVEREHLDQASDPKGRRRPESEPSSRALRSMDDLPDGNPYWSDEANQAAEENPDGLNGKQLAEQWRDHRRLTDEGTDTNS